eukprot:CAMPEP_0170507688 /NCGR_PEP_ID=MMETSP0208-20121228/59736_1 /TAXON_ID=197538 /ORGANISM="Strombidium inclinatum, Strain S3" /LENGTH=59 /DNA_ID=CAMNT_0010790053 /DNA_START=733 /DNA_END=912 /DNA_ORIENTATION=-
MGRIGGEDYMEKAVHRILLKKKFYNTGHKLSPFMMKRQFQHLNKKFYSNQLGQEPKRLV